MEGEELKVGTTLRPEAHEPRGVALKPLLVTGSDKTRRRKKPLATAVNSSGGGVSRHGWLSKPGEQTLSRRAWDSKPSSAVYSEGQESYISTGISDPPDTKMNLAAAYLSRPSTRRILSRKPGEEGFSLIELVVVIAVLAILIVIALPNFQGVTDDAALSAGKKYLVDAFAECTVARTRGLAATTQITAPVINGGKFTTTAATACPTAKGVFSQTFTPSLTDVPDFTVDLYDGTKTCATTQAGKALPSFGCTASKKW